MEENYMLSEHFSRQEIACNCCGKVGGFPANLSDLLKRLEKLRKLLGNPLILTSAYRCPEHNRKVGGVPQSYHTTCRAADFYCPGSDLGPLAELAEQAGFTGIGIYYHRGFVHADFGAKKLRRWYETEG